MTSWLPPTWSTTTSTPTFTSISSCPHPTTHKTTNGTQCDACGYTFGPSTFDPEPTPPSSWGEVIDLAEDDDGVWFLPNSYVWEKGSAPPTEVMYLEGSREPPTEE